MKLTKGRINKVMRCRQQTAKAFHSKCDSSKRSSSDFTRKSGKNKNVSSVLNKTMYRTKHLKEQKLVKESVEDSKNN